MNREKITELAREAELANQLALEVPFVVDRLERFAALIEREVRGDAEPVAYSLRFNDDERLCLSTVFDTEDEAHEYAEKCSYTTVVPLYTHPTPAVVQQLVGALEDSEHYIVLDLARHDEAYDRHPSGERERSQIVQDLEKLRAALAAVKGADV